MQSVKKAVTTLTKAATLISIIVIFGTMMLTVFDVLGRFVFNKPIAGTFELTRIGLAMIVFPALGVAQLEKENIGITIVYDRLGLTVRKVLDVLIAVVSLGLFSIVFWQMIKHAQRIQASGLITSVLRMPVHPWILAGAAGVFVLVLVLIIDFIETIQALKGGNAGDE
ncbi:TRAP transporter small permease [Anoxynatronum buryatiense]|uniref:TRAP-type C4-dicarboxylate transport system, small permease component n=1 Tax=Anoxynatronum buryatiense TaxID=489973 RepID=A0AA45WX41_9CLOT|nr:TRAP transporter small permease [Anoxynatronum buryatiense]SMP62747.1 TRAP-type C4-dicarboxylate transport system, small permease component [Anoxynatronum buryatiense]